MFSIHDSAYPRRGYWEPDELEGPRCPVCNNETDTYYITDNMGVRAIIGCTTCIQKRDAYEEARERAENELFDSAGV